MKLLKPLLNSCAAIALLCAYHTAPAADVDAADEIQVYQVELLLFRHSDQSRTTREIPRMPEAELTDILEQDLPRMGQPTITLAPGNNSSVTDAMGDGPVTATELPAQTRHWVRLEPNQLLLPGVGERLESIEAYELLAHLGWLQTAPDVAEAEDISLADLGVDPELASGQVKLFQRRYLHLAVDIELGNANSSGSDNAPGFISDALQNFAVGKAIPAINNSRRIRLAQLVYFDQPQFGIIASVTRSASVPEVFLMQAADSTE